MPQGPGDDTPISCGTSQLKRLPSSKQLVRPQVPCKRLVQEKRHVHAACLIARMKKQRQKSYSKSSFSSRSADIRASPGRNQHLSTFSNPFALVLLGFSPEPVPAPGVWLAFGTCKPSAPFNAVLSSQRLHSSAMRAIPPLCNVPSHQRSQIPPPQPPSPACPCLISSNRFLQGHPL